MPQQVPLEAPEMIEGVVGHLLHIGYDERTVLRLDVSTGDEEGVTALGKALFGVRPGESLRLYGTWAEHPRYGRQFKAVQCERTKPAGERAIRLYLASSMIRGIGPVLAAAGPFGGGQGVGDDASGSMRSMKGSPSRSCRPGQRTTRTSVERSKPLPQW